VIRLAYTIMCGQRLCVCHPARERNGRIGGWWEFETKEPWGCYSRLTGVTPSVTNADLPDDEKVVGPICIEEGPTAKNWT